MGVAERKNKSLKEMATYMMEAKNLPPNFRAEAINCAAYIQNRVPHKQLDGITPFEAWSGHKPEEGFAAPNPRVSICWVL